MSNRSIRRWESTHPSILDTHHPEFFTRLEQCAIANQKIAKISSSHRSTAIQFCQKLPWITVIMWQLGSPGFMVISLAYWNWRS